MRQKNTGNNAQQGLNQQTPSNSKKLSHPPVNLFTRAKKPLNSFSHTERERGECFSFLSLQIAVRGVLLSKSRFLSVRERKPNTAVKTALLKEQNEK